MLRPAIHTSIMIWQAPEISRRNKLELNQGCTIFTTTTTINQLTQSDQL